MYTLTQRLLPALGKEADVRTQLIDVTKYLQAKGRNTALLAQVFSSDGPALIALTRADDLNMLDQYRRENLEDAEWQSRAARVLQLLRGPVAAVVAEMLIAPSGSGPVGVVQRVVGFPALGKEREFRSITEEFVKSSQASGLRVGMSARIFSSIGPAIELNSVYSDLAGLERSRTERISITRDVARKLHEISREPIRTRIYEVLVPLLR
jgi:hypothetical protein